MADDVTRPPESRDQASSRAEPGRPLSEAARRALAEAEERRRHRDSDAQRPRPPEVGGRGGLDPARYGDWEKDGIISDF